VKVPCEPITVKAEDSHVPPEKGRREDVEAKPGDHMSMRIESNGNACGFSISVLFFKAQHSQKQRQRLWT